MHYVVFIILLFNQIGRAFTIGKNIPFEFLRNGDSLPFALFVSLRAVPKTGGVANNRAAQLHRFGRRSNWAA
jgi:hypothetical protein